MTNKEKLTDIQCLINEFYSMKKDRNCLSESAEKSRELFNQYCRDIGKDLEMLEPLKTISKIINNNMNHLEAEIIDGYPTGNIFIGMTNEDLNNLIDELAKIKEWLENEK